MGASGRSRAGGCSGASRWFGSWGPPRASTVHGAGGRHAGAPAGPAGAPGVALGKRGSVRHQISKSVVQRESVESKQRGVVTPSPQCYIHVGWVFSEQAGRAAGCPVWCRAWPGSWPSGSPGAACPGPRGEGARTRGVERTARVSRTDTQAVGRSIFIHSQLVRLVGTLAGIVKGHKAPSTLVFGSSKESRC